MSSELIMQGEIIALEMSAYARYNGASIEEATTATVQYGDSVYKFSLRRGMTIPAIGSRCRVVLMWDDDK